MDANVLLATLTRITVILITLVTLIDFLRNKDETRLDIFLMFADFALVVLTQWGTILFGSHFPWLGTFGSLLLVANPLLLLRLVRHLRRVPPALQWVAAGCTLLSWVLILAYPTNMPGPGILFIVLYFASLEIYCAVVLFRGALTTSGVTHWRLLLAAGGSGLVGLLLLLPGVSGLFPRAAAAIGLLSQTVALLSEVSYYLGFATPGWLRRSWQLGELYKYLSLNSDEWVNERRGLILQRLCEAAERTTGGFAALAALWDPTEKSLRLEASSGPESSTYTSILSHPAVVQACSQRLPTAVRLAESGRKDPLEPGGGDRAVVALAVPVANRQKAWGILIVLLRHAPLFASDDLALLSLLSEQTAIMLGYGELLEEQRGLLEQQRRYNQRLKAVNELDRSILAARSPQMIVNAALSRLRELVPSQRASVILFDDARGQAEYIAANSEDGSGPDRGDTFPLDSLYLYQRSSRPDIYVDNASISNIPSPIFEQLAREGMRSIIATLLIAEKKLVGELLLSSTQPSAFQSEHQEIAREVANQLAIAIQQARLREELQNANLELEQRVDERTAQLQAAVTNLEKEVAARKQAESSIIKLNQDLKINARDLQTANKELEAFAYSVSHDLRAPLRAIDGFSRILTTRFADTIPEEARRYLELVRSNTQQMGQLIDDLLSFSRLSRQPLEKQLVDPAGLAKVVFRELNKTYPGRQVDFSVGDLPPIQADYSLLKQVFFNLLSNSLKFTGKKERASIEVGCLSQDGKQVYYVKDNGAGFDMRYADKLFGVFQRLHRQEEFEGTGVGLAIVHRIISRHGGRIWAESAVDQGATFYFTL